MRVLTLLDLQNTGGASIACNRISDALRSGGNLVFSISADGAISNRHYPLFLGRKFQLLSNIFRTRFTKQVFDHLQNKELNRQLSLHLNRIKPELINVHNLHSAGWPISLVKTCLKTAPVVWTLHDCWSFLGSFYPSHTPPPSHKLKREIIYFWESLKEDPPINKLSAVTPSSWMKRQALKSYWADYNVETIPNPIPDSYFISKDRLSCKLTLNLNEDKIIVLCIAGNLSEERKGGKILRDILSVDFNDKVEFLVLGENFDSDKYRKKVTNLGFIKDEITIQIAYQAADIVIHPAPIDNLPNTVVESISCGTPVLAFNTGGISDLVVPNESGWLVEELESQAMINMLKLLIQGDSFRDLRENTKYYATQILNMKTVSERYLKVFND